MPPFRIQSITVDPPLLLAPMEDVTSLPMRLLAKRIANPGLMFTEFVSAMAVHYNAQKTLKKMQILDEERPLGIQIFGADPKIMADTARLAVDMGADLVDINMGCWVPKVCKTGSGAALLKDPDLAADIVSHVVKAVNVPVTVKVRAGWDYSLFAAPDLARRFQDAGIQMLTLHARFAKQGFDGQADWTLIKQLREAVTVPLIGNGDVKTPEDALTMLRETGADGVMVGRAAISNPWALRSISNALQNKPQEPEPTIDERIATALEHARLQVRYEAQMRELSDIPESEYGDIEVRAIRSLRGQLPIYIKGIQGAPEIRAKLTLTNSVQELEDILLPWAERAKKSGDPKIAAH